MVDKQRKSPQQTRARQTVHYILQAAAQLLDRSSSTQITTNNIAERAGISIGTLYRYFGDKDEIFDAVTLHILDRTAAQCRVLIDDESIRNGDELIERLVDVALSGNDDDRFLKQNVLRMLSARPSVRDVVHRERHKVVVALGQRLSDLEPHRFRPLEEGDLRSISAIWRGMVLSLSEDDPEHLSRAHIKRLLIRTAIDAYSADTGAGRDRDADGEAQSLRDAEQH